MLGHIEENLDFAFGRRKSNSVLKTTELGSLDKPEEISVGVGKKTEVVDEKNTADTMRHEGGPLTILMKEEGGIKLC